MRKLLAWTFLSFLVAVACDQLYLHSIGGCSLCVDPPYWDRGDAATHHAPADARSLFSADLLRWHP
jgi:hypothetical protein